ncbi:MAG: hypothetical protein KAR54_02890 [Candidatus Pacebacteria bacterium]|nr:hypothetical protein [Candidatus Paceibacterota bacterium]
MIEKLLNFTSFFAKTLILCLFVFIFIFYGFALFEPSRVMAVTDEVVVSQTVTSGITISSPDDITLTALSLTQNSAVGSTTWTVITNNQAGYTLSVKASSSPALVDSTTSESFTDYTSSGKEAWSVSDAYEFGWSAFGDDVTGHGTDTNCVATTDVPSSTLLWEGFNGTADIQMGSSTSETIQAGTDTTLCVATEQDTVFAPSGTYAATLTATAVVQ